MADGESKGWMIEFVASTGPALFWDGRGPSSFKSDSAEGVRFVRYGDAMKVMTMMLDEGVRDLCEIRSHLWTGR